MPKATTKKKFLPNNPDDPAPSEKRVKALEDENGEGTVSMGFTRLPREVWERILPMLEASDLESLVGVDSATRSHLLSHCAAADTMLNSVVALRETPDHVCLDLDRETSLRR